MDNSIHVVTFVFQLVYLEKTETKGSESEVEDIECCLNYATNRLFNLKQFLLLKLNFLTCKTQELDKNIF